MFTIQRRNNPYGCTEHGLLDLCGTTIGTIGFYNNPVFPNEDLFIPLLPVNNVPFYMSTNKTVANNHLQSPEQYESFYGDPRTPYIPTSSVFPCLFPLPYPTVNEYDTVKTLATHFHQIPNNSNSYVSTCIPNLMPLDKECIESRKKVNPRRKMHHCSYEDCDYQSNRISNLKNHIRVHTREKPFKCDQCCYTSSNISNLRVHVKRHNKNYHNLALNKS